jgi:hypothetical protein
MRQCDYVWCFTQTNFPLAARKWHNYGNILTQASPQLIKILQAYRLAPRYSSLLDIRLVLNLPWDELWRAICPLRKIIGDNNYVEISGLLYHTPDPAHSRTPQHGSIFWDIAFGYLSFLQALNTGRLPVNFGDFRQVSFDIYDMRS